MNEVIEIANSTNESRAGRYPIYDEEKHIALAFQVFKEQGEGVIAFCDEAGITRQTYHDWKRKHKAFERACELGINGGARKWEMMPHQIMLQANKTGKAMQYNHNYWSTIMRNRYHFYDFGLPKLKDKSPSGRMRGAWKALENGNITPQEFNLISSGLMTELKIEELQLQKQAQEHTIPLAISEATDAAIEAYMLVKSGKGKVVTIEEEIS